MKRFFNIAAFTCTLLLLLLVSSCENSEAYLIDYSINEVTKDIEIVDSAATINITFPGSVTAAENIVTTFELSEGASLLIGDMRQTSGVSEVNYEAPFSLQVISENEKNIQTWSVRSYNNGYSADWGLGGFISEFQSNDRSYDWYINQGNTGPFSSVNCAPSSVVMACRWNDEEFPYSVVDARSMYHPEGGGWYTSDIDDCLTDFNIHHQIIELAESWEETSALIREQLDSGNLLMVCIDIHYLQYCSESEWHIDRYYKTIQLGTGHCIVIKGYIIVDGILYFETYDPVGDNYKYSDGQFMGKDRYYRSKDIFTATFGRWNYAFTISRTGQVKKSEIATRRVEYQDILIL